MGNIGSQSGLLKYRPTNTENILWSHSLPRTQTLQQNQLKVLPEKTPKIRLRHTENGEILQTGGTLTGRQQQSKYGEIRELKKYESEPHLHNLLTQHHRSKSEFEKERKFRKKYRAPPPPSAKFNTDSSDSWDAKNIEFKQRLFKTKIQSERKKSIPECHEKSNYLNLPESLAKTSYTNKENLYTPSHRLSLPALNTPEWDFQGELKEATRRLRRIRSDESDYSSEDDGNDISKWNKLKTLDHHIDKNDFMKLNTIDFERNENRSKNKETKSDGDHYSKGSSNISKNEIPKQFYFGMLSSTQKSDMDLKNNDSNNYYKTEYSNELKHDDSDVALISRTLKSAASPDMKRFSLVSKRKQSSHDEYGTNSTFIRELKHSQEDEEEPVRIFSIFPPTRSTSNDRSRSGDSGISGDGSPAVCDKISKELSRQRNEFQSVIPGWTPQQDLGDDSSFEEESFSTVDSREGLENQDIHPHVFSLSLPRDHHIISSNPDLNDINFKKMKRSMSGILCSTNRKGAQTTIADDTGNWSLNKSCNALNSNLLEIEHSHTLNEIEDFLLRKSKINTGRLMYLPNSNKTIGTRRYETRNKIKTEKEEKTGHRYMTSDNSAETRPVHAPKSLQDPPVVIDRRSIRKKSKRFTFQSTIRQIERKRIADKLSREAEKKEQQRLRELEVMQEVEKEFQRKRAREKVNLKQQLSRYTIENSKYDSTLDSDIHRKALVKDVLLTRTEPDGAVSSSPTSSLSQLDNSNNKSESYLKKHIEYIINNKELSQSDTSDDNRTKVKVQTEVLSEYRQPRREYKDYTSNTKYLSEGLNISRQTTIHPKVTYKMPKSKGVSRYGNNNHRRDFASGLTNKGTAVWSQPFAKSKSLPNKYYSQFGPLTRF